MCQTSAAGMIRTLSSWCLCMQNRQTTVMQQGYTVFLRLKSEGETTSNFKMSLRFDENGYQSCKCMDGLKDKMEWQLGVTYS
jgi:hypothetical protein